MSVTQLLLLGLIAYLYFNETSNTNNTIINNNVTNNSLGWVTQNNEKKLSQVNPLLAAKVRQIINLASNSGYILYIDEAHRTQATQDKYYAQGRTTAGNIITYKKVSEHTLGKAVDLMPVINGKPTNSLSAFNWQLIGNWSKQVGGLIWGGNWQNLKDYRHLELI